MYTNPVIPPKISTCDLQCRFSNGSLPLTGSPQRVIATDGAWRANDGEGVAAWVLIASNYGHTMLDRKSVV